MILDIITISLIIIFIVIGAFRGLARMVMDVVFTFCSYLLAGIISKHLVALLYTSLIQNAIIQSVSNAVTGYAVDSASGAADALPEYIKQLLQISSEDISSAVGGMISPLSDQIAVSVEQAVQPVIISILGFLFTIILFLVLYLVMNKLLKKPILKIFDFPIIKGVNHLLGGVLGAIDGVLTVCVIATLLKLLMPLFGDSGFFLSESTIYNSSIFSLFYSGNIFSSIINLL